MPIARATSATRSAIDYATDGLKSVFARELRRGFAMDNLSAQPAAEAYQGVHEIGDMPGLSNGDPGPFFAAQGLKLISNRPTERDGRCWWVTVQTDVPIYPGVPQFVKEFKIRVPQGFYGDLLWRVGYDDGIEPPNDQPPGRLSFRVVYPKQAIPIRFEDHKA